jgi:hypothetical protein
MSDNLEFNMLLHKARMVLGDAYRNGVCDCVLSHGACHICGGEPALMPKDKDHVFCMTCFAQIVAEDLEPQRDAPDEEFDDGELEDLARQLADIIMEEIIPSEEDE